MKKTILLLLFLLCNSCIVISPEKLRIIDNRSSEIERGVQITINEEPRPFGSNNTTIEIYKHSENSLINGEVVAKKDCKWFSVNDIKLENGKYRIVTYYYYFGKNRLETETEIGVENNIVNIEIEYPLFVTGKAKLKVY
ncbi:MAG: hypothetical protein CBC41_004880 [Flavobacteriaceae bacterium TMED81]|nr:MAG: hypothetical protein CBC41_004880 [Flavobacteriaceae bacterium TMED81]